MTFDALIHEMGETIQKEASVQTVFGSPIKLDQHTLVPVALVTVSLGGGVGGGQGLTQRLLGKEPADDAVGWTGGGGGGGLNIATIPIGFLSEKDGQIAFTAIGDHGAKADLAQHSPIVRRFLERLGGGN